MLTSITSLTGNGLKDWLIQRLTALYFAVFSMYLLGYLILHTPLTYSDWSMLFHCRVFQAGCILALLALTLHTWIGIWTVTTDYIRVTYGRLAVQAVVVLWLLAQFLGGSMIIWG